LDTVKIKPLAIGSAGPGTDLRDPQDQLAGAVL
jgi:hypothetical protein